MKTLMKIRTPFGPCWILELDWPCPIPGRYLGQDRREWPGSGAFHGAPGVEVVAERDDTGVWRHYDRQLIESADLVDRLEQMPIDIYYEEMPDA